MKFRVLTYNIHKGFTSGNRKFVLKHIKSSIHEVHADVICLQEVVGHHRVHAKKHEHWPKVSQFEYLADRTWHHFAYGKNAVYSEGHHGNAVLSKYPILFWENEDVSFSKIERRGLLHTTIELQKGKPLVHLFSVHLGLFENDRVNQVSLLCDRISRLIEPDAPIIIAGDFNDWRQKLTPLFESKLGAKEAFLSITGKHADTFPSVFPMLPLDRIYYRNLKCTRVEALRGKIWRSQSDHLPLMAEFQVDA